MSSLYQKSIEFLFEKGGHRIFHSNRTFIEHCVGVAKYLTELKCDEKVIIAGLLHNVYGNEKFDTGFNVSKKEIVDLVGIDIEKLIYLFSICNRNKICDYKDLSLLLIFLVNEFEQSNLSYESKTIIFDLIKFIKQECEIEFNMSLVQEKMKIINDEYKKL